MVSRLKLKGRKMKIIVACLMMMFAVSYVLAGERKLQIDHRHVSKWAETTVEYFDPNKEAGRIVDNGRFGCLSIGPMKFDCWTQVGSWTQESGLLCQTVLDGVTVIRAPTWLGSPYSRVVSPAKVNCLTATAPRGVLFQLGELGAQNLQVVAEAVEGIELAVVLWWNDADVGDDSLGWVLPIAAGSTTVGFGLGSSPSVRWMEIRGSAGQVMIQAWGE